MSKANIIKIVGQEFMTKLMNALDSIQNVLNHQDREIESLGNLVQAHSDQIDLLNKSVDRLGGFEDEEE